MQMYYIISAFDMRTLEEKYNDINGSNFENEAAKILLRYKNEGRPD